VREVSLTEVPVLLVEGVNPLVLGLCVDVRDILSLVLGAATDAAGQTPTRQQLLQDGCKTHT